MRDPKLKVAKSYRKDYEERLAGFMRLAGIPADKKLQTAAQKARLLAFRRKIIDIYRRRRIVGLEELKKLPNDTLFAEIRMLDMVIGEHDTSLFTEEICKIFGHGCRNRINPINPSGRRVARRKWGDTFIAMRKAQKELSESSGSTTARPPIFGGILVE